MPNLTRRGPNATTAARMPALPVAPYNLDPELRRWLEGVREWLEVRLGSRGDFYERAVTHRELQARIDDLEGKIAALAGISTEGFDPAALQRQINQLKLDLTNLRTLLVALQSTSDINVTEIKKTIDGLGGAAATGRQTTDSILLLHFEPDATGDMTIVDSSPLANTVSIGGAARIAPNEKVFGTHGYVNHNGTNATGNFFSVTISGGNGNLTGDFTIELFVRDGGNNCIFYSSTMGYLYNGAYQGYGGANLGIPTSHNTGQWRHLAVVRSGSTLASYLDGVRQNTLTYSSTISVGTLYFGYYQPNGNLNWLGYFDEIHISNGTCWYTGAQADLPWGPYYT